MHSPEILAPAGSPESLVAALRTGADAVYAGGKKYSARNSASNFTDEELAQGIRLCHSHGAKFYIAVNTVISDDELADFSAFVRNAAKMGVDGYIVQDWGAAEIIRRCVSGAVLHCSTQMSVHTAAGAKLLSQLGYARVVPARELHRNTLKRICAENIETEIFIHGALCMSVSGQCYMSAMIGSRSANRGCCGQACRLPFSAAGNKNFQALSLKDLSLLENIRELAEMGVDSLKIEGRMKRPEYIAAAVSQTKNALEGSSPDMKMLRRVFSRSGFTDGYFTGSLLDMYGIREHEDVLAARDIFPALHELYRSQRAVFPVDFDIRINVGKPVFVRAVCGDISAEILGDIPDTARNSPIDGRSAARQFSKLGDTVFSPGNIDVQTDDGLFIPAGKLNELRRNVMELLTEELVKKNTPLYEITGYVPSVPDVSMQDHSGDMPVYTFCRTVEQAVAAAEISQFTAVPESLITPEITEKINTGGVILSPPRFITDEDRLISRLSTLKNAGYCHLLCHTADHIAIGKQLGFILHGSFTLNLFNSLSADSLRDLGLADCIVSPELTLEQIGRLRSELPLGAVIYGRLPLMLNRNCPIKNEVGCGKCSGCLTDRTNRKFPVACSGDHVEILNSDVLYMGDRLGEIHGVSYGAVLLSDENADQTIAAISGAKPAGSITRGLYYRGVR